MFASSLATRCAAALGIALVVSAIAACSDSTSPQDGRSTSQLRLLHVPVDAPPLVTTTASFYAVKGKSSGIDIWYHARAGASDSTKFLQFRVGANSLATRADGSPIAAGDSVLITLTVVDPRRFIVQFEPSGLTFSPNDMPKLTMSYLECQGDLNYDGVIDGQDAAIASQLEFWRQETPSAPWFRLPSVVSASTSQVEAQLGGFTGYALSY